MIIIKQKILNYCIKHLFNGVTENDVLRMIGKNVIIDGRVMDDAEKRAYSTSAKSLGENLFYKQALKEIMMVCNRQIMKNATDMDGVNFGRSGLWIIEVLEKKRQNVSNLQYIDVTKKEENPT